MWSKWVFWKQQIKWSNLVKELSQSITYSEGGGGVKQISHHHKKLKRKEAGKKTADQVRNN